MHQYPKRINQIVTTVCAVLLVLNLAEYALAWARAIYAPLYSTLALPYIALLGPFQDSLFSLLVAHIGLLGTLVCIQALGFIAPKITSGDQGLVVQSSLGTRVIPFEAIRDVRSVELPNGRFIVWLHSTRGLPLQGLVASLLFGQRLWRGFLITSDLSGFDALIADIVSRMKAKYGEQDFAAHWREEPPTWEMRMLSDPTQTIHDAVNLEDPPFTLSQAGMKMTWSSLPLALPLIAGGIIHLQIPWWAIVIVLMGILEWPLISAYLSMMPIGETHHMAIESALAVYPLTQLTRWVPALVLALLVVTGVPGPLLLLSALPAVAWGSWPVRILTEQWFESKAPESLLGIIGTVIYQLFLYEAMLFLVPR